MAVYPKITPVSHIFNDNNTLCYAMILVYILHDYYMAVIEQPEWRE